ncbi:MAG: hypothetical protein ACYTFG_14985, partial [Planctomycetota bacterium]
METEAYALESDEETVVEVFSAHLSASRELFEACREDPAQARDLIASRREFSPTVVQKRAGELIGVYESAREEGVGAGRARDLLEKRRGLA